MKTLFAIAVIFGLAFTNVLGSTNDFNQFDVPEALITRYFKINSEIFEENLKHLAGVKENETEQQMLSRFFKQNGIELKTPESLFLTEKRDKIFVHTSTAKIDKIERLVIAIQNNVPLSKVH